MTPSLAQRCAEDEITMACDGLTAHAALAALTEIQAQILADHGIAPGTRAFEAFLELYSSVLPARVRRLHREALAGAH